MSRQYFIGTSGWNYSVWKEGLYKGVRQKDWLSHYATVFNSVEVNATFYRLLKESTVAGWHDKTPQDFTFAAKGSRYISHTKKLRPDPNSVFKQKNNLEPLKDKLKVVLWQLPASLSSNQDLLASFAKALQDWPEVDHVLEFRHQSWFSEETFAALNRQGLGICISDAGKWPRWDAVSADLIYVRLHGRPETYSSSYSEDELKKWADWIQSQESAVRSVYVFFDNTDAGAAVDDARILKRLLE